MPYTNKRGSEKAKEIGARIANARKLLDLNQRQFAANIGVTQAQLSKYEVGIDLPSIPVIERIAAYIGVNPCRICGWDNEPI